MDFCNCQDIQSFGIAALRTAGCVWALSTTYALFNGSLFAYHVAFSTATIGGFIPNAIIAGAKSANSGGEEQKRQVDLHWKLQVGAALSSIIGFGTIYINKNVYKRAHFQTKHSYFALGYMFFLTWSLANGTLGFSNLFPQGLRNLVNKLYGSEIRARVGVIRVHRFTGAFAYILGIASCYTGLVTCKKNLGSAYPYLVASLFGISAATIVPRLLSKTYGIRDFVYKLCPCSKKDSSCCTESE